MTSFESNRNNSGNFFGLSNGRKRRHESTKKPRSSKALQQFVLEKMEDRWLPTVSWTNASGVLTFLFSSPGDTLAIGTTAVSGSTNSYTFSGTNLTSNTTTNVSSVIFQDNAGGNQTITINQGTSTIVTPLLSNSIESIILDGSNITSNLSFIGSAATLSTTSSLSVLSRACISNSSFVLNGSQLQIPNLYASNSSVTLIAIRSSTAVTVSALNSSTVTVASGLFSTSILNQNGGVATVSGGSALGTLYVTDGATATIQTGSIVTSANVSNGTGSSILIVQRAANSLTNLNLLSGTATLNGTVTTVNQTGGLLRISAQDAPGTGGSVTGSLQITNGTAVITDNAVITGTTSINGLSTVTVLTGANGTPSLNSDITVNNGSLTISDNVILGLGHDMIQNDGVVTLTGVTFNSAVTENGGSLLIQGGTFTKGLNVAGGVFSANLTTISTGSASVAALTITGGSTTVINSTFDVSSQANANAVVVSGSPTLVNLGNGTNPGNNTFNIAGTSSRYFISNNDPNLAVQAQGNIWTNNATTYSASSEPFKVSNYLQGAASGISGTYGPIYFNGSNLYVVNDQQGAGPNNIQSAIDSAVSGETVYVQGGLLNYDESIVIGKSLTLAGVDTGAGHPTLAPNVNGGSGYVFFLRDDVSNATQLNTISNFNVNGTTIFDPINDKVFDVQYSVSALSCLTLSGNIEITGFSSLNPSMLSLLGGKVDVSTSSTLNISTQVAASGLDASFTLTSGSNLNGPFLATSPSANQSVTLSGNLIGTSPAQFLGGSVNLTGTIDGPSVLLDGSILTISGGTVTKDLEVQSGNLVMTSGSLTGSVRILGGNANISGSTISTSTNESNVANNATLSITGGTVLITNTSILASNTSISQRNAVLIDGTAAVFNGADLTLASSCITLASTNNISTAGIRTIGGDNTSAGLSAITLTLDPGVVVTGGQYSIVLNGINTNLTGDTLGNVTLVSPSSDFIRLENYAFYDQNTLVRTTLNANNVTFTSNAPSYSFQPSAATFTTSDLPTLFDIVSKVVDFESVSTVGYVSLYSNLNFVIDGRQIQPVVDALVNVDSTIYIQNGTFTESVVVNSTKTGLILIGAGEYSPGNVTLVNSITGSNAAFLIQANNVQVLGLSINGSNGTTPLMQNGSLSGVNYGVTNFNGTSSEPIGNLTVRNNSFTNLINSGVYLKNNSTVLATSQILDNSFASIGVYGFNGGVVAESNAYTSVSNNTMTFVTNGFVMKDFSLASLSTNSVVNNTISAYATGLTLSGFSGTATGPIVGGSGQGNTFTLASGMNATLGAAITGNTIGVYVQGFTVSSVPTLANNTLDGFAYGYDITNVNQPLTITGGSVSNYMTSGVHVLKNQIFDPNTLTVPGVGSFNPNVTVNALTVNGVANTTGFRVDGNSVVGGASLTLDGGINYVSGNASVYNSYGANASAGSVLIVNQATFDVSTSSNITDSLGILNDNSTLTINSPANITGFYSGVLTQNSAVTRMTGGIISSAVGSSYGALVYNGNLSVTGGTISANSGVVTTNSTSILSIDSSTANTSISGYRGLNLLDSGSVTVNQSTSNLTTIDGNGGVAVYASGTGNLTFNGGSLTSNSADLSTVLFDSIGTLSITGGQINSPNLANTVGISVSNGSASISGVTLNGNAAEGIQFTSTTGNLTITGNSSSPVISAQNIAVNITASNATITGGLIQASNGVGISFSSTGTLSLNSNISATTSGVVLTNGFANISGGTVSNAVNGILFNGGTANGSIENLTFSNNTNDLNLANSTGGISLGANNAFSASGLYIFNQTTEDFLIDGTTTFSGTTLSSLSASNLTQRSNLFDIQDKIVDKLDNASFGLVRLKSTDLFVTPGSFYAPNTSADIQRSIDAAGSGNTIYVKNGTYTNNLDVNKSLNIQGDSSATTTVIASNTSIPTVTVSASNVTMSCLTISGISNSGTGLFVNSTLSNLQLSNSTLSNLSQSVQIGTAGHVSTLGLTNLIMDGNTNGLSTLTGGSLASATLSQIEINQVTGTVFNLAGIVTDLSVTNANGRFGGNVMTIGGTTTNLTITNSNFSNATGNGITLGSGVLLTNATLTNDQFNNLGGYGASFMGNVSGLTIQNSNFNNLSGTVLTLSGTTSNVNLTTVGMTTHAAGILVSGPVTNLILSGVTVDGSGTGLSVTSAGSISGLTISGSTFNNGSYGILAQADTGMSTNENRLTGVSITSSTFANNTDSGISLGMLNDAVLANLNIHDNGSSVAGTGGILLNLTNGTFTNVTLANLTVTDNGLGGNATLNGFGIAVSTTNATLTSLALNNVTISGSGTSTSSMIGLKLENAVALGSTSITGLTVSGSNSTGIYLAGQSTGQTLNIGNANLASSLTTYISDRSNGTIVTATSATFGSVLAGSGLTPEQAYSIVDKITDGVDQTGYGFILLKSGSTYVTPISYTSTSLTPSIQRAINLATTGDTVWIQGNNGSANYTGGVDTSLGGLTLNLESGNSSSPALVNTEGDWTLSSNTTVSVRLGGTSAGSYTQYNLSNQTSSMNLSNAVISYSNLTGFIPTIGDQFNILNQASNTTIATTSRVSANVTGNMTVLNNGARYPLATGQYFMTVYEGGANHNDFVLISAPSEVSNVVVYGGWTGTYFGDPVSYVDSSNTTACLIYGLTASNSITTATSQLESSNASISIANGTYDQVLSHGVYSNNLTYNIIGLSNVSGSIIPDAQQIGNITVSGVTFTPADTINYRVNGGIAGEFDEINTDGPIVLGSAVANIVIGSNFIAPPSINRWLPLLNNTNATANITGQYYFPNGTAINTGLALTIPNDAAHDLYTTYKFGTVAPYNDFALIWSLAPGTQTQVVVDADWANVEFGAVKSYNGANYTIGLDGFAQMQSYDPVPSTTLVGGVTAVSANGVITIANGTYNGTFTANKAFSLVGPTGNETAFFPKASGQTVLLSGSNVTSTNWTGNLRFGDVYIGSGTLFDNAASLIDTDGLLTFQSGATFSNVSLTATRSMTVQSNLSGTSVTFNTDTGCTALSASGTNVNLTFSDLTIGGTGQGMNLTNTGSATFNNVTLSGTLTTVSSLNGPGTLTLNYPASSASNNLTVAQSSLNFTQFGTSNVSLLTANFALNANLGTTAGSAGNNTISLTSNMITGGAITTGGGQDQFNVSSAAPVTISAGSGNDTLTMTAAGAYVRSFNGDTGTDTIRGGNQNNYFDIDTAYGGNISLTRGISSTRTSFANTENLIGNAMADTFSFTSNSARIVSVNGGNGNDYLTFNGTSGANTSISYSNPLEFNVNGSSLGTVNYFNFANSTPTVSVVDNFTSLENLVGGSGSDVFRMKSVGVVQGSIAGTLNGATGNNTLDYSTYSSGVTVNLATRSASGIGSGSTLRISNIRDVYGSASRDRLTGDSGNNILVGNNGNDSILGGDGNDILIGSYGADTLVGGSGWNLDIGGYVNFLDGGASTAYGIPSQYVDFVLGSMMNQWSGVSNDGGFTTASNLLQTTGVSVQTPGNTTSYSNIRLYSDSTLGGPYGTVFNDTQVNSINPGTLTQNWIFYSSSDVVSDGSKVKKSSLIYKSFP